ncbi:unnamed protein product, partial [marine sediment metagenome]
MKNIDLQVEVRNEDEIKSRISRKLALVDYIPAVIYGLEKKP